MTTLFGSATNDLPTTTTITFLEIWMIFSILLTFSEVILHTIIGYLREKQKQTKNITKVTPKSKIFEETKSSHEFTASYINTIFGKIIFPIIFVCFTLTYCGIAMSYYFEKKGPNESEQILEKCDF